MLDKFPGLLGYGGIVAIHADWPTYPKGIGWEISLKTLGNYPASTTFYQIDDIDRCKLLINKNPNTLKDSLDYNQYHIALWHEDLIELYEQNLIKGVERQTEYEFELARFEEVKRDLNADEDENGNLILYYKQNGETHKTIYKRPFPDEDEQFDYKMCAAIPAGITLTESGLASLVQLAQKVELSVEITMLIEPFLKIKRYDTAVREASLFLENSIKTFHNVDNYGQRLIDYHINDVVKSNDNFYSAAIKCYRGELRTIFNFIRNDFAHNFKVLTKEQCKLILARIDETYQDFKEVVNVYYKQNGS